MKPFSRIINDGIMGRIRESAGSADTFIPRIPPFPYRASDTNLSRHGATLIEVMIGILILAILAVGVPTALKHPRLQVLSSAHRQAAIHAANEVLEEALSLGYDNLAVGTELLGDLGARYTLNGHAVTANRSVELLGGGADPEYKRITASVSHTVGDSPVVLETLVTP